MENGQTKPKRRITIKKILLYTPIVIIVVAFLANLVWRYTGSDEWELALDKEGVQVYGLKSPGNDLLTFKGNVRVKSKLGAIVALYSDPDTCPEWMRGCHVGEYIETLNPEELYYIHSYQMDMPLVFKRRELVLKTQFDQDPQSKEVVIKFTATPDVVPPNDCCYRVRDVNNIWTFTPVGDGEVDVSLVTESDFGGFIPDYLLNYIGPPSLYAFLSRMQGYLDRPKYQNAEFDFIEEVSAN